MRVHETLGIGERQRTPELGFEHAEDRRIHTDTERQREDGHGSEAGRFAQHAQAVADILDEILHPIYPSHIPAFLLHLYEATDGTARCIAGFLWTHPRRQVFFDLLLQVKLQFVVQLPFNARSAKQRLQPQQ